MTRNPEKEDNLIEVDNQINFYKIKETDNEKR